MCCSKRHCHLEFSLSLSLTFSVPKSNQGPSAQRIELHRITLTVGACCSFPFHFLSSISHFRPISDGRAPSVELVRGLSHSRVPVIRASFLSLSLPFPL